MTNRQYTVAVFCATGEEFQGLLRSFPQAVVAEDNFGVRTGTLEGEFSRLLLLCPGVGHERTRACARRLLMEKRVRLALSTGIAGSLAPRLRLGDIVFSHRVWGYQQGTLRFLEAAPEPGQRVWDALQQAVRELPQEFQGTWSGPLVSSDRPVADASLAGQLHQSTGGLCVEMEAMGLSEVCRQAGVPFLGVKIMSDFADQDAFFSMLRHQRRLCRHMGELLARVWQKTEFGD